MDPLTAFSLAGTIIQFVDFGSKLFSEGRALYGSTTGALTANEELELILIDLRAIIAKLKQPLGQFAPVGHSPGAPSTPNSQMTFDSICDGTLKVAEEMIKRIGTLKLKDGKKRAPEVLRKVVKNAWSKSEMDELQKRLASFKSALDTGLVMSIRDKVDAESIRSSARFDSLDLQSQRIISALFESMASSQGFLSRHLTEHTKVVTSMLMQFMNRTETMNRNGPRRISKYSVAPIGNIPRSGPSQIIADVEMLDVSQSDEAQFQQRVARMILDGLSFPSMRLRYEDVVEAYPDTFKWVYRDPHIQGGAQWSNFVDWLKTGNGIYWINGKAGSGKSTLMKYIFDQSATRQHLTEWAGGLKLYIASFFFWSTGSQDQKSQTGLLRAILFQILEKAPELIPIVMPEYWAEAYSNSLSEVWTWNKSWTLRDLQVLFKRVASQSAVPAKICLLVDGLDEFNGDHEQLVDLFAGLLGSHNIKACVSSRPWVIFEDRFRGEPSLRLQDITHRDIQHYVRDRFHSNDAFRGMDTQQPEAELSLVNEVVERADGVFLWVRLVVKSLLDGIRSRDDVQVLQKRLRAVPRDLELLYKHLLNQIDSVHMEWASKALQIVRGFRETGDKPNTESHRPGELAETLSIAQLYFALSHDMSFGKLENLAPQQLNSRCQNTLIHLTARCAGLLEVPAFPVMGSQAPIQYIHATAASFLAKEEHWSEFLTHTNGTNFRPSLCLMRSCLFTIWIDKNWNLKVSQCSVRELVSVFMINASYANENKNHHRVEVAFLDKLDQIMTGSDATAGLGRQWIMDFIVRDQSSEPLFLLHFATVYGLTVYVEKKLLPSRRKSLSYPTPNHLLHYLLRNRDPGAGSFYIPAPQPEMVTLLLRLGADPNWKQNDTSAWTGLLRIVFDTIRTRVRYKHKLESQRPFIGLMKILLTSGADPRARISTKNDDTISVLEIVANNIMPSFPTEAETILNELELAIPSGELALLYDEITAKNRKNPNFADSMPARSPRTGQSERRSGSDTNSDLDSDSDSDTDSIWASFS